MFVGKTIKYFLLYALFNIFFGTALTLTFIYNIEPLEPLWGDWKSGKCKEENDIFYKTEERECIEENCVGDSERVMHEACDGLFN